MLLFLVLQKYLSVADSFSEKILFLKKVKNILDAADIEIDKHACDFGSILGRHFVDNGEKHFTQDVSFLFIAKILEFSHSLFQKLNRRNLAIRITRLLKWLWCLSRLLAHKLLGLTWSSCFRLGLLHQWIS